METAVKRGTLSELLVYFLRLGLLGFGGPVALVGQTERELVAERGCAKRLPSASCLVAACLFSGAILMSATSIGVIVAASCRVR